ncbi:MAG: hypothetical protein KAX49_20695, partial [Halanaerobiales bacterium]|nr:hypothetical protein [Halanaerobiales bacterium]
VARVIQQGINIKTEDIFRYKTITDILKNVDYRKDSLKISQEEVVGEVLLTPIQKWFFDQNLSNKHFFNQSSLFSLREDVDLKLLENVFKKVIEHHDALRMGYKFTKDDVLQYNKKIDEVDFKLRYVDLSQYPYDIQKEKLKEISNDIQDSLNLEKDLLIKGIVFDLKDNGKRLLIAIHHLVIDAVSWGVLIEDIETLYNSNLQKQLALKTTSFQEWSQRLNNYATTEEIDIEYWKKINVSKIKRLTEESHIENCFKDHKHLSFELNEEQTGRLLTKVNWAYSTEINDILLSALTIAFSEVMEADNVFLNLEGHGREEIMNDVDILRTIGWFTSLFPVFCEKQEDIEQTIKHVKESLRKISNKGLDFGIGRYLTHNENLKKLIPEISFNYFGQLSQKNEEIKNKLLSNCFEELGMTIHGNNQLSTLIDITGAIVNEKLQFTIRYNNNYINDEKMSKLANKYNYWLNELIEHCINKNEKSFTASDYGVEDVLDEDDLDYLNDLLEF